MHARTTLAVAASLLLLACAPTVRATYVGCDPADSSKIHCPCHPEHCRFLRDIAAGDITFGTELSMRDDTGDEVAYPPAVVNASDMATLVVRVNATSGSPMSLTQVNVSVTEPDGIEFVEASLEKVVFVDNATDGTTTFNFTLSPLWAAGDYVFIPVSVEALGEGADGFASLQYFLASPSPALPPVTTPSPPVSTPLPTLTPGGGDDATPAAGWLVLAALAAAAVLAARRRT